MTHGDGTFNLSIQVGSTQIGIGTISGIGATTVTITGLTSQATLARINNLIDDFRFIVLDDMPDTADRTVILTFNDGGNTGGGTLSDSVSQTLQVQMADDPAVARNDHFATDEDTPISGSVLGNDSDVDGPALQVATVNGSASSVGQQIALASGALLTVNANGTFDYDPNGAFDALTPAGPGSSNAEGSDSFTYTLLNGTTATVTIAIAALGSASDWIEGSGGPDILVGTSANDRMRGGGGDDVLVGSSGQDWSEGGTGNDVHYVDDPNDVVVEHDGEGYDTVFTTIAFMLGDGAAVEALSVADNSSTYAIDLTGNAFSNRLFGNAGANILNGAGGADILIGFAGDDIYFVDDAGDLVVENDGAGRDAVFASTDYWLTPGMFVEVLSAADQQGTSPLTLVGNSISNSLFGNAGANILNGGGGADTMIGYGGNDIYVVDHAADVVIENINAGYDTVFTSTSYSLAAYTHVEALSASDQVLTDALDLTGNGFDNVIFGNAGANRIDGGYGNDLLLGYGGADVFAFTTALNGAENVDTIIGFDVLDDRIELDQDVFSALNLGTLDATAFMMGAAATTAEHRIIYDGATGALFYDPDGVGGQDAVRIAILDPNLQNLSAADFFVA